MGWKTNRRELVVWGALGSRASELFDVEGDGDLDIVTNEFNSEPMLLISDLSDRKPIHFVGIRLVGTRSNRDGLGARVTVSAGGRDLVKVNDGKSGYLSQSSMPLYFGLGEAESVDRITVEWPSGNSQTLTEGITVNSLSPGMIPWSATDEEGEAVRASLADKTPVGRNGTPEDFVTAVVFLSAEGSGFVNGHDLIVDGGWTIW